MVKLENGLRSLVLLRLYVSFLKHAIQNTVVEVAPLMMGRTHSDDGAYTF